MLIHTQLGDWTPPSFKKKTKKNIRPMCTVSFLWFLQNKARKKVVKYMSAWQELHALPTKTFHKFYITSIFCSKTCFSLQAWFFFHHTLYTLNIPITCSHNMVMAHTPAQISIYLWLNMEAYSEQRLFLFCTIHVQYRVPFQKKNSLS